MIKSTFMDFYFPESIQHPLVNAMKEFQANNKEYCLSITNAKTEEQLQSIANFLDTQLKHFHELAKNDYPDIDYFFNDIYRDNFNYLYLKETSENNYDKLSLIQKIKLNGPIITPDKYEPSNYVKQSLFEDFGFKYLHISYQDLKIITIEKAFNNFIERTNELMQHMNKPKAAISIYGENGLFLEKETPLYAHLPKAIAFTPDITPSSILHEWTHSIDNYIFHTLSGINDYASENLEDFSIKNHKFLPIYQNIKNTLFEVCNSVGQKPLNQHNILGEKKSIYYHNCLVADQDLFITASDYYKKPCEILARMIESGEFPNHTNKLNKNLTNQVYLTPDENPYLKLKNSFFSVIDSPIYKIKQIREEYNTTEKISSKNNI